MNDRAAHGICDYVCNVVKKGVDEWESSLGKLPESFKDLFKSLDPLRKAEFAKMIACHNGLEESLVKSVSSEYMSADVLFRPRYSSLGMTRTQEILGIRPQTIENVMEHLIITKREF